MRKIMLLIILLALAGSAMALGSSLESKAASGISEKASTRSDVINFVAIDRTNERAPTPEYMCLQYAETLRDNARRAGFEASVWVVLFTPDAPAAHAIVRFETIHGPVYINAVDDAWLVTPEPWGYLCGVNGGCYEWKIELIGPYQWQ